LTKKSLFAPVLRFNPKTFNRTSDHPTTMKSRSRRFSPKH